MLHDYFENKNRKSDAFIQQYGFNRGANTKSTSSFLLHTPLDALRSTVNAPSRYFRHRTQIPESILKMSRHKPSTLVMNSITTTTPLRGDQQPPTDEVEEEFIPLGGKSQPVTIIPSYWVNQRDLITTTSSTATTNSKKRIKSSNFLLLLADFICSFFVSSFLSSMFNESTFVHFQ